MLCFFFLISDFVFVTLNYLSYNLCCLYLMFFTLSLMFEHFSFVGFEAFTNLAVVFYLNSICFSFTLLGLVVLYVLVWRFATSL